MKRFITTVFRSLEPSYLARQYLFGGILAVFMYIATKDQLTPFLWGYLILSFILYPFAMFVYDSLVGLLIGENVFLVDGLLSLFFSIAKIFFIFFFSIVIAPFGILYLYIRNRKR